MGGFKKSETGKSGWPKWYDWLISYVFESRRTSVRDAKGKIMKLFKTSAYDSISKYYKPEKIMVHLLINTLNIDDENISIKQHIEKTKPYLSNILGEIHLTIKVHFFVIKRY